MPSGADIAKAYVQIIPTAEGIGGKLEEMLGGEADRAGKSAGGRFSSIFGGVAKAGLAAVGVAATGISLIAKNAVESYADFEQLAGGAALMYGDAYDTIAENAKNAYATVQMSQNDYLQQVNGFAVGLKTAMGGDAQAAAELADRIVTAEADIVAATGNSQEAVQNAFNGIMKNNFTMLDNLQLGITPTKEGMEALIDEVNKANAAAGNATNYQMGNLADMQSALVDYVAMQGLAGYAANEGAETIQGSIATMSAAWQNLLTGFADGDADLSELISGLVTSVGNVASNIVPVLSQALSGIGEVVTQLAPIIATELPTLISDLLPSLLSAAGDIILALANGLIQSLPVLIPIAVDVILQLANSLIDNIDLLLDSAVQIIIALASGLIEALPELLAKAPEILSAFGNAIIDAVGELADAAWSMVKEIANGIGNKLSSIGDKGKEVLKSFKDGVLSAVSSLTTAGKNLVQGIWDGISNGLSWIKDKIRGWVGNVTSFIKSLFGIHSPSTVMRDEVGQYLALGIGEGFVDAMVGVERDMVNAMPDLGSFQTSYSLSANGNASGMNGIVSEIAAIRNDIQNMKIYLDSGILVGTVNRGLGEDYTATRRRALA